MLGGLVVISSDDATKAAEGGRRGRLTVRQSYDSRPHSRETFLGSYCYDSRVSIIQICDVMFFVL